MRPTLPNPIKEYFSADRHDPDAVASCFTEGAVVIDESRTWTGRDAISEWKKSTTTQYRYTSEPIASEEKDGKIVVTSRLTGNFPGSPVELRYVFELAGDKISSLEIKP